MKAGTRASAAISQALDTEVVEGHQLEHGRRNVENTTEFQETVLCTDVAPNLYFSLNTFVKKRRYFYSTLSGNNLLDKTCYFTR